jgi:mitochondrial chaperone BCS1
MDVWVNFKNATRWQAEGIFKNFFPCKPTASASTPAETSPTADSPTTTPSTPTEDKSEQETGIPKRKTHLVPILEEAELGELAKRFADAVPEDELSVRPSNRSSYALSRLE